MVDSAYHDSLCGSGINGWDIVVSLALSRINPTMALSFGFVRNVLTRHQIEHHRITRDTNLLRKKMSSMSFSKRVLIFRWCPCSISLVAVVR